MCTKRMRSFLSASTIGLFFAAASAHAASWKLHDLNVGVNTSSERINNLGQIVGNADALVGSNTFLYDKNGFSLLGHLSTPNGAGGSWGAHINDAGLITGTSSYGDGATASFVYKNGTMSLLSAGVNDVRGVNNHNLVVGNNGSVAKILDGNGVISVALPGSRVSVYGVNDLGQAVGAVFDGSSFTQSMFIFSQGQLTNLGTAGSDWASADQINNRGVILGHRSVTNSWFSYDESFVYENGKFTNLSGLLGSQSFEARAINDFGQVVGVDYANNHSYLYSDGQMIDLTKYGIYAVSDINESGQIVGHSISTGNLAILDVSAVPEPDMYLLLVVGLLVLSTTYRCRSRLRG